MPTVLAILPEGFEELEAVAPIDVLRRAGVEVTVAALTTGDLRVKGRNGLVLQADTSVQAAVVCAIFYLIYQQVENYVIYPRVMKRSVDVSPAATVVAVLIGGSLLGVVGALLAIPLAAAVQLVLAEVVEPRQDAA